MATPRKSSKPSRPKARPRSRPAPRPELSSQPAAPPAGADPRFVEGIALFNHHRFFECHEALERIWLETAGREKDFYKGLIQAAVACHHWSRGNPAGALTLSRSSSQYLKRFLPEYLGLDVESFLTRHLELFGWLRRHRLRYDERLIPMLQWARHA